MRSLEESVYRNLACQENAESDALSLAEENRGLTEHWLRAGKFHQRKSGDQETQQTVCRNNTLTGLWLHQTLLNVQARESNVVDARFRCNWQQEGRRCRQR